MLNKKKKLLKEFWLIKKKAKNSFEEELEKYITKDEGWFKQKEDELFRFLSRRLINLEVRITKNEIEKIVKRHIPASTMKRWDGNELVMDVDVIGLKRELLRESQIFTFRKEILLQITNYTICPVIKEEATKYFLLIQ